MTVGELKLEITGALETEDVADRIEEIESNILSAIDPKLHTSVSDFMDRGFDDIPLHINEAFRVISKMRL